MPDGQIINIDKEIFKCPELLFNPNLVGRDISGLHHLIYNSIMSSDIDIRRDL
jgi:actin-related protein